ncbi:lactoylglutathione lyase [Neokomagataea thailandica NBRC 106555]|uniref:VOC family protein n=2 Tax=Neokomagataea TaxID=1223423 RepID=A0A4Y6VAZ6_9PROT|nr:MULTISPECIES: VOC family protein [Neokomagataea]QDH25545.1 VOC family protein [Neokomagataea tanensis]GBR55600.1 lactoylglutathione lyase [Neokomagataea thailandica NBRC 106555]
MTNDFTKIEAFHHVAIIASDYERSKFFYTAILGFPIISENFRPERNSWKCDLRVGAAQIELFSFSDAPIRVSRPEARGLRHLAFAVKDVALFVGYLTSKGVICEPIRVDPYTGKKFTFFADPDDLPLELYEA